MIEKDLRQDPGTGLSFLPEPVPHSLLLDLMGRIPNRLGTEIMHQIDRARFLPAFFQKLLQEKIQLISRGIFIPRTRTSQGGQNTYLRHFRRRGSLAKKFHMGLHFDLSPIGGRAVMQESEKLPIANKRLLVGPKFPGMIDDKLTKRSRIEVLHSLLNIYRKNIEPEKPAQPALSEGHGMIEDILE